MNAARDVRVDDPAGPASLCQEGSCFFVVVFFPNLFLQLTVAVFSYSKGKSAIPPSALFEPHTRAPVRTQAVAAQSSGTLLDMPVGSAPVPFTASLSLGTVVTAVQVVSLSSAGCSVAFSFLTTKSGIWSEFGEAEYRINFKTQSYLTALANRNLRRQPHGLIVCGGFRRSFVLSRRLRSPAPHEHTRGLINIHLTSIKAVYCEHESRVRKRTAVSAGSAVMDAPTRGSNFIEMRRCQGGVRQHTSTLCLSPFFNESPSVCVSIKLIGLVALFRFCAIRQLQGETVWVGLRLTFLFFSFSFFFILHGGQYVLRNIRCLALLPSCHLRANTV